MVVTLELVRTGARTACPIRPRRARAWPVSQADRPHGPTLLHLLDLPLGDGLGNRPLLFVAAAGSEEGWRRADAQRELRRRRQLAGGGRDRARRRSIGTAVERAPAPPARPCSTPSRRSRSSSPTRRCGWRGASDDALAGGANLALVGSELVQFGAAEPLGANRFRLSRLLRGRRGTEWAAGAMARASVSSCSTRRASPSSKRRPDRSAAPASLLAAGIGDLPDAASASAAIEGAALQPPSPVHLRAEETPGGDLLIQWVRRSRQGWAWLSGSDTPLGEERELYRLEIAGAGFVRTAAPAEPLYLYSAAQRLEDGAPGRSRSRSRRSAPSRRRARPISPSADGAKP